MMVDMNGNAKNTPSIQQFSHALGNIPENLTRHFSVFIDTLLVVPNDLADVVYKHLTDTRHVYRAHARKNDVVIAVQYQRPMPQH